MAKQPLEAGLADASHGRRRQLEEGTGYFGMMTVSIT